MTKLLVFDIWGDYAHYKKIYATTSLVSYMIPPKTSLYGYISAILGLPKEKNEYLNSFSEGKCKIGIQLINSIIMQRINTNLRPKLGRLIATDNRRPTTIEYVYKPHYRIFFHHTDNSLYTQLKEMLSKHLAVYTPSLGLANTISNFKFIGEVESNIQSKDMVLLHSVIPRSFFIQFDINESFNSQNEIVELSQYSIEMDIERNVTKRDDILLDRKGVPIKAEVTEYHSINLDKTNYNIILF